MKIRSSQVLLFGLGITVSSLAGCSELSPNPSFVGRQACSPCHAEQERLWRNSHHDLAMQEARPDTILGDFEGATFTYAGVESTFFKRDAGFWVRTDGADGSLQEFEVAYTFGVDPLQQYLMRFPDGRLQALNICWDTRPEEEGGQRWFHLYPDEAVEHTDILHWTGAYQNWNHMCAECHSTNVRKNYQADSAQFNTTFSEIDVSCEACHGPASAHVEWAEHEEVGFPLKKLVFRLGDVFAGRWLLDPDTGLAQRDPPLASRSEIETCAPCHSRRSTIGAEYRFGRPLVETHVPALLRSDLYYPDGQILDEVYVYGSFLQSRMHEKGVTCSDCHDPHSLKLSAEGNGVCAPCHLSRKFDSETHHRHKPGEEGSYCVDCHMRSRNYMVVDPRRDHSFRVPRPDLSTKLGVPNACIGCHSDESNQWAADTVSEWTNTSPAPHHGEALKAGRLQLPGATVQLEALASDPVQPGIVRATALELLEAQLQPPSRNMLEKALSSEDPLVRRAAVSLLERLPPGERLQLGEPLLEDPIRAVRLEAARTLVAVPGDRLAGPQRASLEEAVAEYRAAQRLHADRPEAHINLGLLALAQGDHETAERKYREAIRLVAAYPAGYVNLADLMRLQERDAEGEVILRQGLERVGENADLRYALGLLLVRLKRYSEALPELQRAAELRPEYSHYAYVFAVALQSTGQLTAALDVMKKALPRRSHDPELLMGLASFSAEAGDRSGALRYARRLVRLYPDHPAARQLLAQLERRRF